MGFPSKLKNYNTTVDGSSWAGKVGEVTLPPIKKKVEAFRHGGMLAELEAEMGLEKMEMTIKAGGFVLSALSAFGRVGVAGSMIRFNGAYQEDGAGAVMPAELIVRGMHTEWDPGSAKVGDNTEHSLKTTIAYLKWSVSGIPLVEIDVIGCVWIQDGVDRMAAIRAAMGL